MFEEKKLYWGGSLLHFAKKSNGKIWELLEKLERTPEEDELPVEYAHAFMALWPVAGTRIHFHRGVYAGAGL